MFYRRVALDAIDMEHGWTSVVREEGFIEGTHINRQVIMMSRLMLHCLTIRMVLGDISIHRLRSQI